MTTDDTMAPPSQYGMKPLRDDAQRRAASHHRDDDVGHQQHRLNGENHRADVAAFPAVAKHLDRRHEAVALAERPETRADDEEHTGMISADDEAIRP